MSGAPNAHIETKCVEGGKDSSLAKEFAKLATKLPHSTKDGPGVSLNASGAPKGGAKAVDSQTTNRIKLKANSSLIQSIESKVFKVLYGLQNHFYFIKLAIGSRCILILDSNYHEVRRIAIGDVRHIQRRIVPGRDPTDTQTHSTNISQSNVIDINFNEGNSLAFTISYSDCEELCKSIEIGFGIQVFTYGSLNVNFRSAIDGKGVDSKPEVGLEGLEREYELCREEQVQLEGEEPRAEHSSNYPVVIEGSMQESTFLSYRSIKTANMPSCCVYKVEWYLSKVKGQGGVYEAQPESTDDKFYLKEYMIGHFIQLKVFKAIKMANRRSYIYVTAFKGPVLISNMLAYNILAYSVEEGRQEQISMKENEWIKLLKFCNVDTNYLAGGSKASLNGETRTVCGANEAHQAVTLDQKDCKREVKEVKDVKDSAKMNLKPGRVRLNIPKIFKPKGSLEEEDTTTQQPDKEREPEKRPLNRINKSNKANRSGQQASQKTNEQTNVQPGDTADKKGAKALIGSLFKKGVDTLKNVKDKVRKPKEEKKDEKPEAKDEKPETKEENPEAKDVEKQKKRETTNKSANTMIDQKKVNFEDEGGREKVKNLAVTRSVNLALEVCTKGLKLSSEMKTLHIIWANLQVARDENAEKRPNAENRLKDLVIHLKVSRGEGKEAIVVNLLFQSFLQRNVLYHTILFNKHSRSLYSVDQGKRDLHQGYYDGIRKAYSKIYKKIL